MPSSQGRHSADDVLRATARAAHHTGARAPARRSAWLVVAAIAVVLGSAAWIASLHLAASHDDARARSLNALDGQLADLQLLHWRGVAGDLEPQASLVRETLQWRKFRSRAGRTVPRLDTGGIEGLLAQTASDNAIPHRSIAEVRMSGRPLLARLKTLSAAVDAETRAAACALAPAATSSSSPSSPNSDGSRSVPRITSSGEPSGSSRPLRMPKYCACGWWATTASVDCSGTGA